MWIVFGIKFKKRFSTDEVIEKAREDMNALLRSMQKNTVNNVNLVNDTIEKLEQARIAAERKVEQINKKIELLNKEVAMKQFHSDIQENIRPVENKKPIVNPEAAYEVKIPKQNNLFEHPIEMKDETFVTPSGASYKEVPVITTKMYEDNGSGKAEVKKIVPEQSIEDKVKYLLGNGYKVSDIASKLGLSETEVQFVIDLY